GGTCARADAIRLPPRTIAAGGLAEPNAPREPRPRLRLLHARGAALPRATTAAAAAPRMARPRRRHVRPLGEPERRRVARRPLESDRPRLAPGWSVSRRQVY